MKKPDDITAEQAQLLYHDIYINGMTWPQVASKNHLSLQDAMVVFDRMASQLQVRLESNSEVVKESASKALLNIMAMAQIGLQKSQQPRIKTVTKTSVDAEGNERETTEVHEEPHEAGDPRWLGQLLSAVKQLTDLNVLPLPRQVEIDLKSQHEITLIQNAPLEVLEQESELYDAVQEGIRAGVIVLDGQTKRLE